MEGLTIVQSGDHTVVEFYQPALMDPIILEELSGTLHRLVDEQDRRKLVLDFSNVKFISSQFIGILLSLNKKLTALPKSSLVLCGVGPRLMELLQITRLDRVLTIKPSQTDALQ